MSDRRIPFHNEREHAAALIAAIAVMVLGVLLIGAVFALLDRSGERASSRGTRAASITMVDQALTSYEFALESSLTDESLDYLLDGSMMQKLATNQPGMQPVANRTFGKSFQLKGLQQSWMPPANAWSMSTPLPDGQTGWWQIVAVVPASSANPNLSVFVRTWTSTAGATSQVTGEPRLIQAQLRPGRFSDYQILVDGPLVLGDGIEINGRIHTNGYPDAYLADNFVKQGFPLKLESGSRAPTCTRSAGFSTAAGRIENRGACRVISGSRPIYSENTNRRYDLLRGANHLAMLGRMCGARVTCPPGNGPWTIRLSGSSASFTSASGGTRTVNAAGGAVVYLRGSAKLSGVLSSGQLTIGIANASGFNVNGSASVDLVGSGAIGAARTGNAALGLIVEGDLLPRIDQGSCPTGLTAAVVSASGTLGVPPQYRVPMVFGGRLPYCNLTFRFLGSLGTHYMPLMRMNWGAHIVGYRNRIYDFDKRLLTSPPPMFPTTGPWQVSTWKDADPACLSNANLRSPQCR